jgi:glycosyltransferase involved in cell wall biosynthesis
VTIALTAGGCEVSVIIPTTGDRAFLADAVASVRAQTLSGWECIVVLDGVDLLVELPDDPRLRVLAHPTPHRGPAAARNSGLAVARGAFVAFLDDDDLLTPNRLEQALSGIGGHVVHLCGRRTIGREGPELDPSVPAAASNLLLHQPHVGQALVRTDGVVPFDPSLRLGEDVEWWLRMSVHAPCAFDEDVGYLFRSHAGERVGVDPLLRYECRKQILDRHRATLRADRAALARQRARVSAAALLAGKRAIAARWAYRSMLARPNSLAMKLIGRAMLGGQPPADPSQQAGSAVL